MALQCLRILPVPVAAERAGGCAAFVPSRGWDGRATAGCLSPVAGSHMSLIGVVVIITGVRCGNWVRARGRVPEVAFARRREAVAPMGSRPLLAASPAWGGAEDPRCLCSSRLLIELAGMETPSW